MHLGRLIWVFTVYMWLKVPFQLRNTIKLQVRFKNKYDQSPKTDYRVYMKRFIRLFPCRPGPDCSKVTMSLVNVLLKFQTLISEICQNFC